MNMSSSNKLNFGLSISRMKNIKSNRQEIKAALPQDVLAIRLGQKGKHEKAYEQYPHGERLKEDVIRAEIRKRVSELMYASDHQNLPLQEQEAVIERQINRYFKFIIGDPTLHGHVEAPHGIAPALEVRNWCKKKGIVSSESKTASIASGAINNFIFSRPRLFADINCLPQNVKSSLRSEGAVYTREDNLNAVKSQRDLTKKLLSCSNNLNKSSQVINPHLAIYFHGKSDSRGHNFEIATKQREGKGPLDPKIAFWFADQLTLRLKEKDLKDSNGETPNVNVVAKYGAYSGSYALIKLRYGDDVLGFKGFGEMLQCLQLECGAYLRKQFPNQISEILNEILIEFSAQFKVPADLEKLSSYNEKFNEKIATEKAELLSLKNIGFDMEAALDSIALSLSQRENLEINSGEYISVNGKILKVVKMTRTHLNSGKLIILNPQFQDEIIKSGIIIKKL